MEDGRIYRKLLRESGNKECMADLGFRGIRDSEALYVLKFYIEPEGIKVTAVSYDEEGDFGRRKDEIANIKYTDKPMESQ